MGQVLIADLNILKCFLLWLDNVYAAAYAPEKLTKEEHKINVNQIKETTMIEIPEPLGGIFACVRCQL